MPQGDLFGVAACWKTSWNGDASARLATLQAPRPLLVFFDLKAACPSISHAYMWKIFEAFGIPRHLIRAIKAFCKGNVHMVPLRSALARGFEATTRIRQRCPCHPCPHISSPWKSKFCCACLHTPIPLDGASCLRCRYWSCCPTLFGHPRFCLPSWLPFGRF